MSARARSAARTAQSSPTFRVLARAGYVASGVVHALIGILVLVVVFGGEERSDQAGAFEAIGAAPLGFVALWVLAVALWALAAWQVARAITARGSGSLGRRLSAIGQAAAFLAIGALAAIVALGARPDGERSTEEASRGMLSVPGGSALLGVIGAIVAVVGIVFVWMGIARSFRKKIAVPSGSAGRGLVVLGVGGFVAKGVALGVVGVLLVTAAVTIDPVAAGGLDGAVRALLAVPAGPYLGAAVGVGFLAYGLFTVLRARYARLDA